MRKSGGLSDVWCIGFSGGFHRFLDLWKQTLVPHGPTSRAAGEMSTVTQIRIKMDVQTDETRHFQDGTSMNFLLMVLYDFQLRLDWWIETFDHFVSKLFFSLNQVIHQLQAVLLRRSQRGFKRLRQGGSVASGMAEKLWPYSLDIGGSYIMVIG